MPRDVFQISTQAYCNEAKFLGYCVCNAKARHFGGRRMHRAA